MDVPETIVDPRDQSYLDARAAMLAALAELEAALDAAREGGGERAVTRHHARGKLLARERIELLVDRDAPLLELSPVAGWGTGTPVGAGVVTAIGVVEGLACVIVASDPTVRGGAVDGGTLRKVQRAQQIAHQNRLPMLSLLEANGVAAAEPAEILRHTGQVVAGFTQLAADRIPATGTFFGESPLLGGADLTGVFDHVVTLRRPTATRPLTAAGARPVDYHAEDDRDALRLTRRCVRRLCRAPASGPGSGPAYRPGYGPAGHPDGRTGPPPAPTPPPAPPPAPPVHDPEDLLAIPVTAPQEVLSRILDGSELDEDQPGHGPALCATWGWLHGHPVGVLADTGGPTGPGEADKAARFVRRAEATATPLVLLRHGAALPAPAEDALAGAAVPLLTVRLGGWQGVSAAAARARFRFAWPGSQDGDSPSALALSGQQDDDGVIDPRDTRTVLGFCLSVVSPGPP